LVAYKLRLGETLTEEEWSYLGTDKDLILAYEQYLDPNAGLTREELNAKIVNGFYAEGKVEAAEKFEELNDTMQTLDSSSEIIRTEYSKYAKIVLSNLIASNGDMQHVAEVQEIVNEGLKAKIHRLNRWMPGMTSQAIRNRAMQRIVAWKLAAGIPLTPQEQAILGEDTYENIPMTYFGAN